MHLHNIFHTWQGIQEVSLGGGERPWSPGPDARWTQIVNTAQSTSLETSAGSPACQDPAWGPGFGARSPPRRVRTRALTVHHSAATRLPARGSSSARPTSPVNSNSLSARTPAQSAASASPRAAHHFLRGSVGKPGRAPRTLGADGGPGTSRLHGAFLHSQCEGVKGRILRGRLVGEGEAAADRPSVIRVPLGGARKPRRRARPWPFLRAPVPLPAPWLPGLRTSGQEPKGSGASSPPWPPRRRGLTHPWPRRRSTQYGD